MYPDTAFVFDFKRSIVDASNRSVVIVVAALVVLMVESDVYINKSNVNASYSVKYCPRGLLCNHFCLQ